MDGTTEAPSLRADSVLLVAAVQKMTLEHLGTALDGVMRHADDYLFDRADQGVEGVQLTALRDLRRARVQIRQRFEQELVAAFQRLQTGALDSDSAKAELSLLSEDALEEQLATEQMVDSLSRRHAVALEMLEQRMAFLAGREALGAGENPVGPMFLAQSMREAMHGVDLSTTLRIAIYKFLERELASALTPLYDRMNARLGDAGILPRLLPAARENAEPKPVDNVGGAPSFTASGEEANPEPSANDHALFSGLIGLLQSWRQHVIPATALPAGRRAQQLQIPELMSALSLLQTDPSALLDQALGDDRLSLGAALRSEVLAGARRLGIGGEDLNLSSVQEDAVDLVGMLFDVLLDEHDFEPGVRRKIGRMLVPYVKVAVTDRRMFVYKAHPARRFLNAVAEACEGNHGEAPQERELLERVDASINRLVAEFNEDVAIFTTLEQELRAFMAQQRQRIEIAERRAAETQRGRERLEHSRMRAIADIDSCRAKRDLPPLLEDMLTRYVAHHLTQVSLRGGAESTPYVRSMQTIAALLATFDAAERHMPVAELPPLDRSGLTEILASSGCVASDAEETIELIQRSLCRRADRVCVSTEATQLPHQSPGAPIAVSLSTAAPVLEIVGGHDLLDFDPAVADTMRALEIGTWLQLTGESGRSEPAKVSWISPISSRFLFVNRRGTRVLVASAEELAAMARKGRVQLRLSGTAFDDALQQMMGRLQSRTAA